MCPSGSLGVTPAFERDVPAEEIKKLLLSLRYSSASPAFWQGFVLVHMIVSTQRGSKLYERTLRWLSYDNLWINYTRSRGCSPLGLKNRGSNQENQTKIKDSGLAPPTAWWRLIQPGQAWAMKLR